MVIFLYNSQFTQFISSSLVSLRLTAFPVSEINSRAFAASHGEMIKIMKRVPIPRET